MDEPRTPLQALEAAIAEIGSQAEFARVCGVAQPSVWHWLNKSRQLSHKYVLLVEARTKLRPDIYPIESSRTEAPPEGTSPTVPKLAVGGVPESLKGLQT
jgi:DNA-binding transcriptional regulator YdaS (Cro superfamily)